MIQSMQTSSVILCTRNRPNDIVRCLKSIAIQSLSPTELIIIDSSDSKLQDHAFFNEIFNINNFSSTKLVYVHTKPGLTFQRNQGIAHASGGLIYFFDDDVVLEGDYLEQMNKVFLEHSEYAAGMGDITNIKPASSKYQLFRAAFLLPREQASGNFTWSGMPTHPYGTKELRPVQVLGGCCMVFRKKTLQEFEFDEHFHGYSYLEDCEIAQRISMKYPIVFNPQARLAHYESPLARDRELANAKMFMYNYHYIFFKNVYTQNRLYIFGYIWSVLGLFIEALLIKKRERIKGYQAGLQFYYKGKL